MQDAIAFEPDERHGPELVTSAPVLSSGPEQMLLRMLEVVHHRVESIHAGQRLVAAELKAIRDNRPAQRKPLLPSGR